MRVILAKNWWSLLIRGAAAIVDALMLLLGATGGVAVCRSFIGWLSGPLDSAAWAAMALLVGFIASMCWFVRYALRATVLRPSPNTSNHPPQER
jgi:hypothetical protein